MDIQFHPNPTVGYTLVNSQEAVKRASQAALLDIRKARERGIELHKWMEETRETLKSIHTEEELKNWKDLVTRTVHTFMNDMIALTKHIQFLNPPLSNEQVRKLIEIIQQERFAALNAMEPLVEDLSRMGLLIRNS